MIVLDENFPESQRQLLRGWRFRIHQVGYEVGRKGLKDTEIIPLLFQLRTPTFFPLILIFINPNCAIYVTAWFMWMWASMKQLLLFDDSSATVNIKQKINARGE
jgi:hypothetical protein